MVIMCELGQITPPVGMNLFNLMGVAKVDLGTVSKGAIPYDLAMVGLVILLWRRLSAKRLRVISTPMDFVVLILLLVSVISGVLVATLYRFGTFWFTAIFSPYLVSVLTFQPQASLVAPLPWLIKLHVTNFFILLAIFPFSRLVHILTYPLGYLIRPWQIVINNRKVRQAPGRQSIQSEDN